MKAEFKYRELESLTIVMNATEAEDIYKYLIAQYGQPQAVYKLRDILNTAIQQKSKD